MQKVDFADAVQAAVNQDSRYVAEAYIFLQGVLSDAVAKQRKDSGGEDRHVSGVELLDAFRVGALREFGPMAITVLEEWGVACCEDVGELVFNLIEVGAFGKSETDRREDFASGYSFQDAFVTPFLPASKREKNGGSGDRAVRVCG